MTSTYQLLAKCGVCLNQRVMLQSDEINRISTSMLLDFLHSYANDLESLKTWIVGIADSKRFVV